MSLSALAKTLGIAPIRCMIGHFLGLPEARPTRDRDFTAACMELVSGAHLHHHSIRSAYVPKVER
jgi:hypothetical protein